MRLIIAFVLFFFLLGQQPSHAFYPIQGSFTNDICEAYTSFRKQSEPIPLSPGKVYTALGLNKENGDYISIEVDGSKKWVNKNCGQLNFKNVDIAEDHHNIDITEESNNLAVKTSNCPAKGCAKKYVLALSWQPAFCENHPHKKECKTQSQTGYDASNFTLHGLWPDQLAYCGVSDNNIRKSKNRNWRGLPAVDVDAETDQELDQVMPGVQSYLDRHEWIKHGTCDGRNADDYYDISVDLLKEVNASDLRNLFAQNIGKSLTLSEVNKAFERSFGRGSSRSLSLKCKNGLATEIRIKMKRPFRGDKLADLLIPSRSRSCKRVIVDAVGIGR
ncbi:MAG: ribonuclease T2 [Sphaerospermopsis sp. SIO1G1]|nr:ribonuclease T2 [Sphaerospermopsis sp. SIO1G1]